LNKTIFQWTLASCDGRGIVPFLLDMTFESVLDTLGLVQTLQVPIPIKQVNTRITNGIRVIYSRLALLQPYCQLVVETVARSIENRRLEDWKELVQLQQENKENDAEVAHWLTVVRALRHS
jgi:hypothetical protein